MAGIRKLFEPRYGLRTIDQKAWRCLERCRTSLKLDAIPLPVPVDQWIETALELRFGVGDLSHLGDDVLGASFVSEREIMIDEKVLAHEGRFRFTCAHELGHMELHKNVRPVFHDAANRPVFDDDDLEREADRFAASFLMPVPLLQTELLRVSVQKGLDVQKTVIELMVPSPESLRLWKSVFLPAITENFAVSLSAAVFRCEDLRLTVADRRPLLPSEHREPLLRPRQEAERTDPDAAVGPRAHRQMKLFE